MPAVILYGFRITGYILKIIASGTDQTLVPIQEPELREAVRQRSKVVLGNKDRAEVGAAVALSRDGLVNATDLSLELGLPNSRVRAQLRALASGRYLKPVPSLGEKKIYERVPAQLWDACLELIRTTPYPSGEGE